MVRKSGSKASLVAGSFHLGVGVFLGRCRMLGSMSLWFMFGSEGPESRVQDLGFGI